MKLLTQALGAIVKEIETINKAIESGANKRSRVIFMGQINGLNIARGIMAQILVDVSEQELNVMKTPRELLNKLEGAK